ncbi:GerAB/ArcD/ProY family transporter [Bacillus cereus]
MKNTVTSRQFLCMMIQFQIGIGLLSLPHTTYLAAGKNAWILILLAGILIQFSTFVFWLLCKNFPKHTFFDFLPFITGTVFARVLTAIYILYFMAVGLLILLYCSHILKSWILPHTPTWFTHLLIIGTAVYLTSKDLRIIGRFFILSFPCLILLFILICSSLNSINFSYLLPIPSINLAYILNSSTEYFLALTGFEAFLFLYPYIQGTAKKKLKVALLANLFVHLFYTFTVVVTILNFAPAEMKVITEPVLYLIKTLPFEIISRLDLIFLSIWITAVITSFVLYLYLSSNSFNTLFRFKNKNQTLLGIAITIYILSILLPNHIESHFMTQSIAMTSFILTIILPFLLLVIFYIKRKRTK